MAKSQGSLSQVKRDLGLNYSSLRHLLEREIDEETIGPIKEETEIFLGIDEHSFKHQELVHMVTEVKKRKVLGILRDDRIATSKNFLTKILEDRVREVLMKSGCRNPSVKLVEALYPEAKVVADHFHVITDSNKRMDEARRIEQDVHQERKAQIPRKIFLIAGEKLSEETKGKLETLLAKYSSLKGFYWAKEKIRELYHQQSRGEAAKILDNLILNLRCADDDELIRWGNTLRH